MNEPHSVRVWAGGPGGKLYRYAFESPGHVIGVMDSTGRLAPSPCDIPGSSACDRGQPHLD